MPKCSKTWIIICLFVNAWIDCLCVIEDERKTVLVRCLCNFSSVWKRKNPGNPVHSNIYNEDYKMQNAHPLPDGTGRVLFDNLVL
mmetsp:Transcript_5600/g.11519  ORF Transcript_5600/g.11519 Transcript_5600/m.11519 type:complete len:85 (-) Transcript_5600:316-570(-)